MDDVTAKDILHLLIDSDLQSVRERDTYEEFLLIHHAAGYGKKSTEFCKILVEAYPESLRILSMEGRLPIHEACLYTSTRVETVQYLLELFPESIHLRYNSGSLPIHDAAACGNAEIIKFLLMCDL